ncbi:protein KASH5 isoform X14 [Zalophus californianus]|uniref:Protein KASH5 isoform X14 n=1 Tax=Zalophus californianus TaxID=9704 RepID=A0A6J2F1V7_ZALCA|nr:protein KASH5 isoform X14 [Zalophus californianus]
MCQRARRVAPLQKVDPLVSLVYLWDQLEEGSVGTLLSLEEQILNSTFEACDTQRTGIVAVTHVLAYLEAVTGQDPQDARLQTLACNLDPNGEGPQATVDLDTFLAVMRDWIAACQLDGGLELEEETAFEGALTSQQLPSGCPEAEEPANLESFGGEDPRPELPTTADLLSSLEDLELSNRRLAGENAKLQRSVETAEEGSAHLGEEISALRKQLRSTQQALQCAKAVDEELEDLKTLAKNLEEQNRSLLAQARQTEKEQQHLVAEMETLQEETSTQWRTEKSHLRSRRVGGGTRWAQNGKLLAERNGVKRRSEELATEKEALKRQLYECECLICQRDDVLSERTRHVESLAKTLEEYRMTTQRNLQGEPVHPQGGRKERSMWLPRREEEEEAEPQITANFPSLLGDPHPEDVPGSPPESSPAEPKPRQALVPVQKELVPVGRPVPPLQPQLLRCTPKRLQKEGGHHTLGHCPLLRQHQPPPTPGPSGRTGLPPTRVARPPLTPAPLLGLLLLLLFSLLLLGRSPPPTWPHLQLCYLQPPPV